MKVAEIGEFALIRVLQEMVCESGMPSPMTLGIGDDAAAWHSRDSLELATTDTMVEGVHFLHDALSWRDLGWKALAVNISDIAAMGGLPLHALVTLGLKPDTEVDDVRTMYDGMLACCREYGLRHRWRRHRALASHLRHHHHCGNSPRPAADPQRRQTRRPGIAVTGTSWLLRRRPAYATGKSEL